MKKYFFAFFLFICVTFPSQGLAQQETQVFFDGQKIAFTTNPIIYNGITLVEFRPIFEKLGLKIGWNETAQIVTGVKEGLKIELQIGENSAIVNNEKKDLQIPPQIINGRTFVPLRFVSEASGASVNWNGESNTITIESEINANKGIGKMHINASELEKYLNNNYSMVDTNLTRVFFNFSVFENDSIHCPYDFKIYLGMDSYSFERTLNSHLDSIKYADTAKADVEVARAMLKKFIEEMAKEVIQMMPDKKILGQNEQVTYLYPALKMDKLTSINYSWTNYEPLNMNSEWPGERPDDYFKIIKDIQLHNSEKVKQYEDDERARDMFQIEYAFLGYHDFKLSNFRWAPYLDRVSSSKW